MNIQKKLNELYDKIQNEELKKDIKKIAAKNRERKTLLVDLEELESLVKSEKVEYEDFIGHVSIDK